MFGADICLGFMALSAVTGAGSVVTHRAWAGRGHLAPAYGLMVLGLVANVVWVAFWLQPGVGRGCSLAILALAIVTLVRARFWRCWREWLGPVVLTAGVGAATVGFTFIWGGSANPFGTTVVRFTHLPSDNLLQHVFADRLWKGEGTTAMLDGWNGSDRPPLQSGLLLLVRPLGRLLGLGSSADQFDAANMQLNGATSVLCQLVWIPAALTLVRALRLRPPTGVLTVLFCAASPLVFRNTTYTWPKLMAAGLALAAIALLLESALADQRPRPQDLVGATVLAVLAFLSHGGVAFTAPLFLVLAVIVVRRMTPTAVLASAGVALGLALATYAPWVLYGRFGDPSTDRLLKWHLGGVIKPDDKSLLETLRHSYRTTPAHVLVSNREANLRTVSYLGLRERADLGAGWVMRYRALDFYYPTIALGFGSLLTVGLLAWYLQRRIRRSPVPPSARLAVVVCLGSLLSVLVWALILFIPYGAVVHVGSYASMLCLLAVPFAMLADRHPLVGWALVILSLAYAIPVYATAEPEIVATLTPGWVGVAVVGLVACIAVALEPRGLGGRQRSARAGGRHRGGPSRVP